MRSNGSAGKGKFHKLRDHFQLEEIVKVSNKWSRINFAYQRFHQTNINFAATLSKLSVHSVEYWSTRQDFFSSPFGFRHENWVYHCSRDHYIRSRRCYTSACRYYAKRSFLHSALIAVVGENLAIESKARELQDAKEFTRSRLTRLETVLLFLKLLLHVLDRAYDNSLKIK